MDFNEAKEKAVNFITLSYKTKYEVKQKLAKIGCEDEIINKVIEYLIEIKYIDDEKYVSLFIKQNLNMKKYSVFEIIQKLKQKGIDRELINNAKYELEDCGYEQDVIKKIVEKKSNYDSLKLKSYLYRRGFNNIDVLEDI